MASKNKYQTENNKENEEKTIALKKEDMDFVEMLRTKTDEADIESQLKTCFGGGYSKESVLDYFAGVRKNQQMMSDTFKKNYQSLFEEKEKIRKANDNLQIRLSKVETEYNNLSDSMQTFSLENKEFTIQDIAELKNTIAAHEENIKIANNEKNLLEIKISQLENDKVELNIKLDQANTQIDAQREMILTEKRESKLQRDTVSNLSSELEGANDQVKYWKALQTEGKKAELTAKVAKLTEELATQAEIMTGVKAEAEMKENNIKVLKAEIETLKTGIITLKGEIESLTIQNDKLLVSNSVLIANMEQEYKKSISLITERSDAEIEKQIALSKLSEAEGKLSLLELEISGKKKSLDKSSMVTPEDTKEEANL